MKIIESETRFNGQSGLVVVESENNNPTLAWEELRSAQARTMAIAHAGKNGLARAGTGIVGAPYRVDQDGHRVGPDASDETLAKPARFRIDIPVTGAG